MQIIEVGIFGILLGSSLCAAYFFLLHPALTVGKPWRYTYRDDRLPSEWVEEQDSEDYPTLEAALIAALADLKDDNPRRRPVLIKHMKSEFRISREALDAIEAAQSFTRY